MATTSKSKTAKKEIPDVGFQALLLKILKGKARLKRPKDATLFSQGEKADAIYFVQTGKVQLTVVSPQARKAALATLGPHDFFGEECLAVSYTHLTLPTILRV